MEKMYAINTGVGYYTYFYFDVFLRNLNEESEFRDTLPHLRQNLSYAVTSFDAAICQTAMISCMDIGV